MTKKIWQLKIQCCDATKKCEVDSSYELEDLCQFILDSYGFDDDHLHQFYFSNSGHPYGYDVENIDSSNKLCNILPREDKKKLFLLFDFGDEWIFKISHLRWQPKPSLYLPAIGINCNIQFMTSNQSN